MFQYLRTVKDINYNRNQSKKNLTYYFSFKKGTYTVVKIQKVMSKPS